MTICSVDLGAPIAGLGVLAFLGVLDICPRLDEGGISCVSPVFEVIASIAMAIVLLSVFMGLPALLALGGLIFLAFDLLRRWRKGPLQVTMEIPPSPFPLPAAPAALSPCPRPPPPPPPPPHPPS